MKAIIQVGNAQIEIEAERPVQLVEQAGFWGECPTKCGLCDSGNIGFFSRKPKGNLYVGMKCRDCKGELNFGQSKDGGGLFIKHDATWNAEYKGGGGGNYGGGNYGGGGAQDDDQIPF